MRIRSVGANRTPISRPYNDGVRNHYFKEKKMSAKKASTKASASKQSASKSGSTKKGSSKMGSVAKTQIKETAAKVLAGAAAGAVRAIIGPLEEVADTGEKAAGLAGNKVGGKSTGKSSK